MKKRIFGLLMLLILLLKKSAATTCKGRYFVLSNNKLSQSNAKSHCNGKGGHLASIYDETTQNQISSQANAKVENGWTPSDEILAYIGGEKIFSNEFRWPNGIVIARQTGTNWNPVGYNNWFSGNIQGSGSRMVLVGKRSLPTNTYTWKWSDGEGTTVSYYICEYQENRTLSVKSSPKTTGVMSKVTFNGSITSLYLDPLILAVTHNGQTNIINSSFVGQIFTYAIEKVNASDDGIHSFSANDSSGTCSLQANVQIRVADLTAVIPKVSPLTVAPGDSIEVNCSCAGLQMPECNWLRKNAAVETNSANNPHQNKSTLTTGVTSYTILKNANQWASTAGEYVCKATLGSAEISTAFTIYVKSRIQVSATSLTLKSYESSYSVSCETRGYPRPVVNWQKNGANVPTTTTSNVYQNGWSDDYTVNKTLHIKLMDVSDGGKYQCNVSENAAGPELSEDVDVKVLSNVILSTSEFGANPSQTLKVDCASYGIPTPDIWWRRSNTNVSLDATSPIYQTKSEVNTDHKSTATLHFSSIQLTQSGRYFCQGNNNGVTSTSVAFLLQTAANISLNPSTKWKVAELGQVVSVDCISFGWRAPTVNWMRQSKSVSNDDQAHVFQKIAVTGDNRRVSRLNIALKSVDLAGPYKCQANNINSSFTKETLFDVHVKANITMPSSSIGVLDGSTTRINCTSSGFPVPSVYWTRNRRNVSHDRTMSLYQVITSNGYHTTATLILQKVLTENAGSYICFAINTVANNIQTLLNKSLTVKAGPSFVSFSPTTTVFNQTQTLSCAFDADDSAQIHWTINDVIVSSQNVFLPTWVTNSREGNKVTSRLTINAAVLFGSNATVKCWAENEVGVSKTGNKKINTDIDFRGGQYYRKHETQLTISQAETHCSNHGGSLPTFDYLQINFIAAEINQFWIKATNKTESDQNCVAVNGTELDLATCNGSNPVMCIFPVAEIANTSNCFQNNIQLTWKDLAKIDTNVSYRISAENTLIGSNQSINGVFLPDLSNTYTASIANLSTDSNFNLTLTLYPEISKRQLIATSKGSTSSVFQSVVGNMTLDGNMCHITIQMAESLVTTVTSLTIRVQSIVDGKRGDTSDIPLAKNTLVKYKTDIEQGEKIEAWVLAATALCTTTSKAVSGSCARGTDAKPPSSGNHSSASAAAGASVSILILLIIIGLLVWKRSAVKSWIPPRRNNGDVEPISAVDVGYHLEQSTLTEEENPYGNVEVDNLKQNRETRIAVDALHETYVNSLASNHATLNQQFALVKKNTANVADTSIAKRKENAKRNRYKNIVPYDRNYVPLEVNENNYVNASFIEGYKLPKKWIATQGPVDSTLDDFWSMLWQQNTQVIVMLANLFEKGKSKCVQYWPDTENTAQYGNISVKNTKVETKGCYVIRHLMAEERENEYTAESRTVTQFHFTAWPDHGVPATTSGLLRFYDSVNRQAQKLNSDQPIAVHCSAGAGRTGTFIGLDYLLSEMNATGYIDVYQAVFKMREQRMEMVQTVLQYIFLHKLLYEIRLLGGADNDDSSLIKKNDEMTQNPTSNVVVKEFQRLAFIHREPIDPIKIDDRPVEPYNPKKKSGKFSAYNLQAYDRVDGFVISTEPNQDINEQFWSMLMEKKISVIIFLGQSQKSCYWPDTLNEAVPAGENISFKLTNESVEGSVTERTFLIENPFCGVEDEVVQLEFSSWSMKDLPASDLFKLISSIESHRNGKKNKNILVHAKKDLTSPALFCVCLNLVARYREETMVDVYREFKDAQDCVPGLDLNEAHYSNCYSLMKEYINSFSSYANFSK